MVKEKRNLYKCLFKINWFKVSYELITFGFQAYTYLNKRQETNIRTSKTKYRSAVFTEQIYFTLEVN